VCDSHPMWFRAASPARKADAQQGRAGKVGWAATSLYGIRTGGTHHPAVPACNMLRKIPTFVLSVLALLTAHSRREDNLEEADSGMRR
jgi:hypothetical protein